MTVSPLGSPQTPFISQQLLHQGDVKGNEGIVAVSGQEAAFAQECQTALEGSLLTCSVPVSAWKNINPGGIQHLGCPGACRVQPWLPWTLAALCHPLPLSCCSQLSTHTPQPRAGNHRLGSSSCSAPAQPCDRPGPQLCLSRAVLGK